VCFFTPGALEPTGSGELLKVTEVRKRLARAVARITSGVARTGGFAMWDFPPFALQDGFIVARACDDVLGAALALCVMDELARRKPRGVAVWALLTRAEEAGFLGALEALRLKTIPRRACVLSLECSKAAGIALQGEGAVVRVGDRGSIFDPQLSEALRQAAEALRRKRRGFKYQRKLMDGGTCEATPFCAYGYRASGLALPLGNYHNQATTPNGPDIGPETVHADDFACGVRLLVALALQPRLLAVAPGKLPAWIKVRAAAARRELAKRAQPPDFGF
jgi:endoglucanase